MGRHADTATRLEANANFIESEMPEVAKAIRGAAEIIRDFDKYER